MGPERRPYRGSSMLDALVMALLAQSNRPMTVYDIAARSKGNGSPVTATQVYRVLARLASRNEVQRIELLAAYLPARGERLGFLVCRCCRSVESFPISPMQDAIEHLSRTVGFSTTRTIVEALGLCAECADPVAAREKTPPRRKDGTTMKGMKPLLAFMMTVGAMIAAVPLDAAERRPGVLYDDAGKELGTISITDAPKGVLLRIEADGLPPGWHGIHFHEKADCRYPEFKGAGGHVHSEKPIVHGFLVEGANDAGDLPNIYAHSDGKVAVELYSTLVSVDGRYGRPALRDEDGSALVIHANPDDYSTQPIGGAGERIACAAIAP